jgi:hypothetical protein
LIRFSVDTDDLAVAANLRPRRGNAFECGDCPLGAEFVDDLEGNEDQDNGDDGERIAKLAPQAVKEAYREQQQDHRLGDLFCCDMPEARGRRREEKILAVLREPCGGVPRAQSDQRSAGQFLDGALFVHDSDLLPVLRGLALQFC